MATIRYTFDVVKHRASKYGRCSKCGKRTKRAKTFEATINPYNLNALGDMKSESEIRVDLQARAAVWLAQPTVCSDCE